MKRTWPGYLPPVVALGVTLAFGLVFGLVAAGTVQDGVLAFWLLLLRLAGPVILAVTWGAVLIMARPHRAAAVAAALAAGGALVLLPAAAGVPLAGSVAAGLAAGTALGARWRLDVALAVVVGLLVSTVILDVIAVPVDRQMALIRESVTPVLEDTIPPGADQGQRLEAQKRIEAWLDGWFSVLARLYPLSVLLELLVRALMIMSLIWVTVRMWGWELPSWRPPRFGHWRLPFYLVWLLIAGLGLLIMRHPVAVTVGLNLAMFAAILLAVQGVAVQVWVTGRMFSLLGRIVFWTVMGLFMIPLVLASGVLLGLVDQWLDLRGLERGSDPEGGK